MISELRQQDIGLWEVWIEYDQFHPEYFGTLYVLGEILTDQKKPHSLIQKIDLPGTCQTLALKMPAEPRLGGRLKEVLYSEPICNLNEYTAVSIYAGNELITHFDDIEILV